MNKKLIVLVSWIALFTLVFVVYAGGGYSFTARGGSLTVEGYGTGLGNVSGGAIVATASLTGYAECQNKGGNLAPGQVPITLLVSGEGPAQADSSGKVYFSIYIPDSEFGYSTMPARDVGCPNNNWVVADFIHDTMVLTLSAEGADGLTQNNSTVTYNCVAGPRDANGEQLYSCAQA